jgi:predicted MFS family arabinose efflux permease
MSAGQLVIIGAFAVILAHSDWRAIFFWGALGHLTLLPLLVRAVPASAGAADAAPAKDSILTWDGLSLRAAARTRPFWLLLGVYALCGFDDFFVSTHMVAFAQDRGVDALLTGHLLALMGLVGFAGVIVAGAWSDKSGPVTPAVACFLVRSAFALIFVDQSPAAIAAFASCSA